jgi:hypothetical protein
MDGWTKEMYVCVCVCVCVCGEGRGGEERKKPHVESTSIFPFDSNKSPTFLLLQWHSGRLYQLRV